MMNVVDEVIMLQSLLNNRGTVLSQESRRKIKLVIVLCGLCYIILLLTKLAAVNRCDRSLTK